MPETTTKPTRIPTPLYAAAGAGDLAYQQLRKLPTVVGELSGRAVAGGFELREKAIASLKAAETTATSLRDRANSTATDLQKKASSTATDLQKKANTTDLEALREQAIKTSSAFVQAAQERAVAVYSTLVAHGERVIGSGVVQAADTVNADIESTEAPKSVTATPSTVAAKPAKVARAKKTTPPAAK
jgi:heparin binding hemagglutinin HbhA